jgi:3'-phosphoadenosine 5'-phosphosulfate sulfotransferase (PAPS reductase)/FAD synthetase
MSVTPKELKERQALSLRDKIRLSEIRIEEWYKHWNGDVYVSVSGRDSSVLLDIVRNLYPDIPAVFCDTGLEFPEIKTHIKTIENVTWLKPEMSFKEVIEKYGFVFPSKEVSQKIYQIRTTKSEKLRHKRLYGDNNKYKSGKLPEKWKYLINAPIKISHRCCDKLKKRPFVLYERETGRHRMTGEIAADSHLRRKEYISHGCNAFDVKRPVSRPLGVWTHRDILEYVDKYGVSVSEIYSKGYEHTGCIFCMVGCHKDNPNKFQLLQKTHPKLWKYCMNTLGMREVLEYCGIPYKIRQQWFDFAPFIRRGIEYGG